MSADLELLAQLTDETEPVFNRVESRVDQFGNKVVGSSSGFNAMQVAGVAALTAIATAAAATTVAVGAVVVNGTKMAIDLEQQMGDVAATMNTTLEAVKPLKGLVMDLAVDPRLRVSASQAADAIQMLSRNGLNMREIMEGAALGTVALSNATGGPFAQSADLATDIMSVFKMEAKDMMTAVDGVVSVTTNSKFAIQDYVMAFASAGGVARASGVDFHDFNVALAGMSPIFSSGRTAGTSFKVMLQRLIPTSKEATALMKELGLMTADGSNQFFDAEGNLKSMADVTGLLENSLKGLTEEQRNLALATLFGTDASRAAIGLMELGADGFRKLSDQMSKTDALRAAATRMDTVAGALDILKSLFEGFQVQIGDAFLPIVRLIVEAFIDLAEVVGPQAVAIFSLIGDTVASVTSRAAEGWPFLRLLVATLLDLGFSANTAVAVANIARALGDFFSWVGLVLSPLANLIGQYVTWQDVTGGLLGVLRTMVLAVLPLFAPALAGIVAIATPIITTFLTLTAVSAGLRLAWENDLFGIQTLVTNVFGVVRDIVGAFVSGTPTDFPWHDLFPPWLANIAQEVSHIFEGLITLLGDFGAGIVGVDYPWEDIFPDWLAGIVYDVVAAIQNFSGVWEASLTAVFDLIEARGNLLSDFWNALVDLFSTGDFGQFFTDIATAFADFASEIESILTEWSDVFLEWAGADSWLSLAEIIITEIINGLTEFGAEIASLVSEWSDAFLEWAGADTWGELAVMVIEAIGEGLLDFIDFIGDTLSEWSDAFLEWAGADTWGELAVMVIEAIGEGLSDFVDFIADTLEGWSDAFLEWAGADTWGELAVMVIEAIGEGLSEFISFVGDTLEGWSDAFLEWAEADSWSSLAATVIEAIGEGLSDFVDFIADTLEGWSDAFLEWAEADSWSDLAETAIDLIVDGFTNFVDYIGDTLESWQEAFFEWAEGDSWWDVAETAVNAIADGFTDLVDWVNDVIESWSEAFLEWAEVDTWGGLGETITGLINDGFVAALDLLGGAIEGIVSWLTEGVENNQDAYEGLGNFIVDAIMVGLLAVGGLLVGAAELGLSIVTAIWEGIGALDGWLVENAPIWGDALAEFFSSHDWGALAADLVANIFTGLSAFGSGILTSLGEWFNYFLEWATGSDWGGLVTRITTAIGNYLKTGVTRVLTGMGSWLPAFLAWANKINWRQLGFNIVTKIIVGLALFKAQVRTTLTTWWDAFRSWFASLPSKLAAAVKTLLIRPISTEAKKNFSTEWPKVASEWWKKIKDSITKAKSNFIKRGQEIVSGIVEGIRSAASTVWTAIKELAGGASDAMSQANEAQSPSRLYMRHGHDVGRGYFMGIRAMFGLVSSAGKGLANAANQGFSAGSAGTTLDPFANVNTNSDALHNFGQNLGRFINEIQNIVTVYKTSYLEKIKLFLEVAEQAANLVPLLLQALNTMSQFSEIGHIAPHVQAFARHMFTIVDAISQSVTQSQEALEHTQTYVETASAIADLVEPGIAALQALKRWEPIAANELVPSLQNFASSTSTMVAHMLSAANQSSEDGLKHAQTYADTVSKISSVVEPAINALLNLSAWQAENIWHVSEQSADFALQTGMMVLEMAKVAANFTGPLQDHTRSYAETVGTISNIVRPAITALQELSQWRSSSMGTVVSQAQSFASQTAVIVGEMAKVADAFSSELLTHTSLYADTVGKIAGILQPAIDALSLLANYVTLNIYDITNKSLAFRNEMFIFMNRMTELATNWSAPVLEHTQTFADAVIAVTEMLRPAMDALAVVADYVQLSSYDVTNKSLAFRNELFIFMNRMTELATNWSASVLEHTQLFAKTVSEVAGMMQPAIDALKTVVSYSASSTDQITQKASNFTDNLKALIVEFESAASAFSTEGLTHVQAFAQAVKSVVEIVEPALIALGLLVAFSIPITSELAQKMFEFRVLTAELVIQFASALNSFTTDYDVVANATAMAGAVSSVVAIVEPTLNAIMLLANSNIEISSELATKFYDFRVLATEFVLQFASALNSFTGDYDLTGSATEMAAAVGAVVAIVKPALEAIVALANSNIELTSELATKFYEFRILAAEFVIQFASAAEGIGIGGIQAAGDLAKAVATVVGIVKPTLEALALLKDYVSDSDLEASIDAFIVDLLFIAQELVDGLTEGSTLTLESSSEAADIAKEIKTLLSLVKTAIGALTAINGFTGISGLETAVSAFTADLLTITIALRDALIDSGLKAEGATADAAALSKEIKTLLGVVKVGLSSISLLSEFIPQDGLQGKAELFGNDLIAIFQGLLDAFTNAGMQASEMTGNAATLAKDIKGTLSVVKTGLTAISTLSGYTQGIGLREAASLFAQDVIDIFTTLHDAFLEAGLVASESTSNAATLAKDIKSVLGIVKSGVDAIASISSFVGIDNAESQAALFADNLIDVYQSVLDALVDAGLQSTSASQAAADFAKDAKALIGIIKPGIDAINELALYIPANGIGEAARQFTTDILIVIDVVFTAIRDSTLAVAGGLDLAADLAGEMKKIIGIIKPGVEAIAELGGYVRREGIGTAADNFAADIIEVTSIILDALIDSGILVTRLVENAGDLAKELKAIIGIIKPGVEALAKLSEYTGGSVKGKAEEFTDNIILVATTLLNAITDSESITSSSLSEAAKLAGDMESLLKTVKPGIEALNSLGEYTSDSDAVDTVTAFAEDLLAISQALVDTLILAAEQIGTDAIASASDFAQAVLDIAEDLDGSIDTLQEVAHSETPSTTRVLNYITAQARTISDSLSDANGDVNGTAVQQAATFAANLDAALTSLNSALQALQEIADVDAPDGIASLLQQIFDIFTQNADAAQQAGQAVGQGLADGTTQGLADGEDGINTTLADIIETLINNGRNDAESSDVIGSVLALFLGQGIDGEQGNLLSTLGGLLNALLNDAEGHDSQFRDVGEVLLNFLGVGIDSREGSLLNILSGIIGSSIGRLNDGTNQFRGVGEDYTNRIGTGVESREANLLDIFGLLVLASLSSLGDYLSQFRNYGEDTTDEIKDGVNQGKTGVVTVFEQVAVDGVSVVRDTLVEFHDAGFDLVTEMKNGANSNRDAFRSEIQVVVNRGITITTLPSVQGAFFNAGVSLVEGLAEGAASQDSIFAAELERIVDEGLAAAETAAQIASPSKKAIKISQQIVDGFMLPLEQGQDSFAARIGGSLTSAFSAISSAAGSTTATAVSPSQSYTIEQHFHFDLHVHGSGITQSERAEIQQWMREDIKEVMDDIARDTDARIRTGR